MPSAQAANGPRGRQHQSSHMLKTGRRGNPYMKDTHDLFATLIVSLPLGTNTRFFRNYHHTFTTDDAAANLASLRFSQSNRTQDPQDPNRIITTTTTTTFSMTRDIAKGMCQHFMDARLIENAADPGSMSFKDRGIYRVTPKGMHILERFITKNGIPVDHLIDVFKTQPISLKLLHLERLAADDEINMAKPVVDLIWKRFAGEKKPNYFLDPAESAKGRDYTFDILDGRPRLPEQFDRSLGVEVQDIAAKTDKRGDGPHVVKQIFHSLSAVDYILDYATVSCRDEAAEVLGHLMRYGYVALYSDRTRPGDRIEILDVRASVKEPGVAPEAEVRYGSKVVYRITDEGRRAAMWEVPYGTLPAQRGVEKVSSEAADDDASSTKSDKAGRSKVGGGFDGRTSVTDLFRLEHLEDMNPTQWSREQQSSYTRLHAILADSQLKSLFRDYLRSTFCDENLSFYLDVNEFRAKFRTTSSAISTNPNARRRPNQAQASAASAMEMHSQAVVASALLIYNNYLAPFSPNELNIDHSLRKEVVDYVTQALPGLPPLKSSMNPLQPLMPGGQQAVAEVIPDDLPALKATQVQTLLRLYERVADHCFRLLATDQVPKFVRTNKFMQVIQQRVEAEERLRQNTEARDSPSADKDKPKA